MVISLLASLSRFNAYAGAIAATKSKHTTANVVLRPPSFNAQDNGILVISCKSCPRF